MTSLRAEQVKVRFGHQSGTIVSLRKMNTSARIVFVLDTSGSMMGNLSTAHAPWKVALQAAADVIAHAPEGTQFGAVAFGATGDKQLALTTSKNQAIEFMQVALRTADESGRGGHTPLYDNLSRGLMLFGTSTPGDVLFVLTDGGENASKLSRGKFLQSISRTRVAVVGILFTGGQPLTPEQSGFADMQELANDRGGMLFRVDEDLLRRSGSDEVSAQLRQHVLPVWDAILYHPYVLETRTTFSSEDQKLNLSFADNDKDVKFARLLYIHRIAGCITPSAVASTQ